MTNKMKLMFVITATVTVSFFVLMSMQFAVDIAHQVLSVVADALSLHETPALSALTILVITGLYLCLAFSQRRNS
jgi:hypothetical protein